MHADRQPPEILVDRLILAQELAGFSDRRMAAELGVSASLWTKTRRREVPVGITILRAAGRRYPELAVDVLASLLTEQEAHGSA